MFTYKSGFQWLTGGSGGTGGPSLNKSDDIKGISAGKCFWITEQVSIARVIVD